METLRPGKTPEPLKATPPVGRPSGIPDYSDAALILVGHGSTLNAESSRPTHLHADTLRRRGLFAEVSLCFWKEHPAISAALRGVFSRRVFVVPLFISEGYFTEQVIPRELGLGPLLPEWASRRQVGGEQTLHYCGPVGTHSSMTRVILARAAEVVTGCGASPVAPTPAECSLFIAGHGTGNSENSRKAIEAQVHRIAALGIYHDVHAIFMEEDPRIGEVYRLAQTGNVVVVPFFISDGLHSFEDIPVMLGASAEEVQRRLVSREPTWLNPTCLQGKRVWYSRSIGDEPGLAEVILERVAEATG